MMFGLMDARRHAQSYLLRRLALQSARQNLLNGHAVAILQRPTPMPRVPKCGFVMDRNICSNTPSSERKNGSNEQHHPNQPTAKEGKKQIERFDHDCKD